MKKRHHSPPGIGVRHSLLAATLFLSGCFHDYEETHVYDEPVTRLRIVAPRLTEINVQGSGRRDISVAISSYFRLNESFRYEKRVSDNGTMTLTLECLNEANHFFSYLDIEAPDAVEIVVEGEEDVTIRDMRAGVRVNTTSSGNVVLSGVDGDVIVNTEQGAIDCADVAGTVHATTFIGSVWLRRVDGFGEPPAATEIGESPRDTLNTIVAFTARGSIAAADITGNAAFEVGGGNIFVKQATGNLTATAGYGSIFIDESDGDLFLSITEEGNIVAKAARCEQCHAETVQGYTDVSWDQ